MAKRLEHAGAVGAAASSLTQAPRSFIPRCALPVAILVAVLAGCTSPQPAPIVRREPVPAKAPAPRPAPAPTAPAAAQPAAPSASGVIVEPVQTATVRSSAVESRPLGSAPAGATPQPISPSAPVVRGGAIRTEPNVAKQTYSDATLAQLRKSAAAPASASAPASAGQSPAGASPSAAPTPPASAASAPQTASSASAPSARGFIWPASGPIIQGFSEPRSMGVSIAGKPGDPVVAAADGRVIFSGRGPRGYGNLLIVKHDATDTLSVYAHNRALLVKEGVHVKRGQRIAELGDTDADRPKLHFEIRKDGKPVDPSGYLPSR